jgi:putative peptidoglycan binding protein
MTFPASITQAGPHRSGNNHFVSTVRPGPGRTFVSNRVGTWNGQHWNTQRWNNQRFSSSRWNNNWNWNHHHHHHFRDFVFFDVGFPFWGYPWYYDYYPYDYYPYGYYPYGYSGSAYFGSGYDYGNGSGYDNSYGYTNGSNIIELQRKLKDAGYYHGPIDGIMGSRTYYALRAYRHDHGNGDGNGNNRRDYPTQRSRPYYPPSNTAEPSPGD